MNFEQFKKPGNFSKDQLVKNAVGLTSALLEALTESMDYNNSVIHADEEPGELVTLGSALCEIIDRTKDDEDNLLAQSCCRLLDMLPDDLLKTAIVGITKEDVEEN